MLTSAVYVEKIMKNDAIIIFVNNSPIHEILFNTAVGI